MRQIPREGATSAGLVSFVPFRDLMAFGTVRDRLFDETVGRLGEASSGLAAPAIDLYPSAEKLVVQAPLPGADPKEIHISVTGEVLRLRVEVREVQDVEGAQYHGMEHRLDALTRSIGLPAAVLADKPDA